MSTDVATQKKPTALATVRGWLQSDAFKDAIDKALPKHMTADRFLRVALTATMKNPKLMDCTQESLFNSLLKCSEFGLEPDGRRAYLIPYGRECQLQLDYKGIAELVMRSGIVSKIHADIVCENDDFDYDRGEVKRHKIDYRKPRGPMYAAYAIVTFKDGVEKADCMTKEEVEAIRKRSKSGSNGPWVTDWNEMAKKTVFRRLSKWVPWSPEIRDAIEHDYDEPVDLPATVIESTATTKSDAIADMLEAQMNQSRSADNSGESSQQYDGSNSGETIGQTETEQPSTETTDTGTPVEVEEMIKSIQNCKTHSALGMQQQVWVSKLKGQFPDWDSAVTSEIAAMTKKIKK